MRWTLGLVLLVALGFLNAALADKETIFERNFRILHQEPPLPAPITQNRALQDLWIEQKLDNFNESETRTWQMRYLSNDEFYQEGAPFFIFVGGEWEIKPNYITTGHFYDMAREHNAYLFYTEHRYYGQTRPISIMDNESIKYLSVRQALADLAHFIEEMHATIPGASNSKVIICGGSYSATMVTWFKKLYPNLATGVWASSAPLLAKANYPEYKEITGQSIRLIGGEECYNRIENGWNEMENLFATQRGAEVRAMLKLCNAFDEYNDLDLWTLFYVLSDIMATVVQTHLVGQIEGVCNKIMEGETDISGLAGYFLSQFIETSCTPLDYKTILGGLMDSTYSSYIMRQWTYQTCIEVGWFQTSDSKNQPFGSKYPLEFFTQMCQDIFGDEFTTTFINEQMEATNQLFGGLEPNLENVYFSHGQLDPWRAVGIQDGPQATVVPYYAHCKDLTSISDIDSAAMLASKQKIAELVRTWLGADNAANNSL